MIGIKNNGSTGGVSPGGNDRIISLGTIARDGNTFTTPRGAQWFINPFTCTNPDPFEATIEIAPDLNHKYVVQIAKSDNSFVLREGETVNIDTPARLPEIQAGELIALQWYVLGEVINEPVVTPTPGLPEVLMISDRPVKIVNQATYIATPEDCGNFLYLEVPSEVVIGPYLPTSGELRVRASKFGSTLKGSDINLIGTTSMPVGATALIKNIAPSLWVISYELGDCGGDTILLSPSQLGAASLDEVTVNQINEWVEENIPVEQRISFLIEVGSPEDIFNFDVTRDWSAVLSTMDQQGLVMWLQSLGYINVSVDNFIMTGNTIKAHIDAAAPTGTTIVQSEQNYEAIDKWYIPEGVTAISFISCKIMTRLNTGYFPTSLKSLGIISLTALGQLTMPNLSPVLENLVLVELGANNLSLPDLPNTVKQFVVRSIPLGDWTLPRLSTGIEQIELIFGNGSTEWTNLAAIKILNECPIVQYVNLQNNSIPDGDGLVAINQMIANGVNVIYDS